MQQASSASSGGSAVLGNQGRRAARAQLCLDLQQQRQRGEMVALQMRRAAEKSLQHERHEEEAAVRRAARIAREELVSERRAQLIYAQAERLAAQQAREDKMRASQLQIEETRRQCVAHNRRLAFEESSVGLCELVESTSGTAFDEDIARREILRAEMERKEARRLHHASALRLSLEDEKARRRKVAEERRKMAWAHRWCGERHEMNMLQQRLCARDERLQSWAAQRVPSQAAASRRSKHSKVTLHTSQSGPVLPLARIKVKLGTPAELQH